MATLEVTSASVPALPTTSAQYLTAFAVWLPIGFIGATGVMVGAMQFFGSAAKPISSLAFAAAYGLLVMFSWKRARAILGAGDGAPADVQKSAQSAGFYRAALGTFVKVPD